MDIIVLAGGLSTERDVSLKTGAMVAEALKNRGHRVIVLDVFMGCGDEETDLGDVFARAEELTLHAGNIPEKAPDLEEVKRSRKDQSPVFFGPNVLKMCAAADIVFMALHGENGENGKVQAVFDLFGIRYTGSGYLGSALAMNKKIAKILMSAAGVPVAPGISMTRSDRNDDITSLGISLPVIVKPCCGGSSIGCSIVRGAEELSKALDEAFRWEEELLIEPYIPAREFSIGVISGKALPVIEIAPIKGFYDYKNKYKAGSAIETCPAELETEVAERMQAYAVTAAEALGLDTYSRIDMLLDAEGRIYCLEANTLPGMTPTSLLPQEAAVLGMNFEDLTEELIRISMEKR